MATLQFQMSVEPDVYQQAGSLASGITSTTALVSTLEAAVAAAQAIGTGDASVEVDAVDAATVALVAQVEANEAQLALVNSAAFTVLVSSAMTANQFRRCLEAAYKHFVTSRNLLT